MGPAADLARRLAQNAEAVCREYLSNGRREGNTWRVGDVDNTPGRSLMVRLTGPDSGKAAAGRWAFGRSPSSTAIYAKVDLAALREVAALDLEGLA